MADSTVRVREGAMVVNVRSGQPYDVYVGRGRGSVWGNPFTHLAGVRGCERLPTREMAVLAHRRWLWERVAREGRPLIEALAALHGKRLGCWCAPELCHAETLVRAASWAHAQLEDEAPC